MRESKREKFIRLAENRTNKALDMIRLIGNLSNKAVYDYSEDDVKNAKKQFLNIGGADKFKLL